MASEEVVLSSSPPVASSGEDSLEALQTKLKGALEDRKLLRRHARKLESEISELKAELETKEASESTAIKSLKEELESALEDRKLLRRHARQRDEAGCEAAREAARLSTENEELRIALSVAEARSEELEEIQTEAKHEYEKRILVAEKETESKVLEAYRLEAEAAEKKRRDTLRESQAVVAALKEEVSRLRIALASAETAAITESTRADAAHTAAERAARAAKSADESAEARARAAACETEARFATELRQHDERLLDFQKRQAKAMDDLRKTAALAIANEQREADERLKQKVQEAYRRAEADTATLIAEAALLRDEVTAAANVAFLALSDSFVTLVLQQSEEHHTAIHASPQVPPEPEMHTTQEVAATPWTTKRKKNYTITNGRRTSPHKAARGENHHHHKKNWRVDTWRATLGGEGPDLGLIVDAAGRVTRVSGPALAAGIAAGDRVIAVATVPVDDLADFREALASSPRPVVVDLERAVLATDAIADQQNISSWQTLTVTEPCPSFGIRSPEVNHLIDQWTADPKKAQYLRLWLAVAADAHGAAGNVALPAKFPRGLQLAGLRHELLHGFLALVVPILQKARGDHVVDVKIRRVPNSTPTEETATNDNDSSTDRWDLALKVDIPEGPRLEDNTTPTRTSSTSSTNTAKSSFFGVAKPPWPWSSGRRTSSSSRTPPPSSSGEALSQSTPQSSSSSLSAALRRNITAESNDAAVLDEERAKLEKLAAQRRKAVEEKLAKMRIASR